MHRDFNQANAYGIANIKVVAEAEKKWNVSPLTIFGKLWLGIADAANMLFSCIARMVILKNKGKEFTLPPCSTCDFHRLWTFDEEPLLGKWVR